MFAEISWDYSNENVKITFSLVKEGPWKLLSYTFLDKIEVDS